MVTRILLVIFSVFMLVPIGHAADTITDNLHVRGVSIGTAGAQSNDSLEKFVGEFGIRSFFFAPTYTGGDGVLSAFTAIAFNIKNVVIILAVIFLIIAVIRLLFSSNDEESVKKWRSSIIWVSVGVFFMQMAFSIWKALLITDSTAGIDGTLGWKIWESVLGPIVNILQLLASFGFILMIFYAFYTIVSGAGDEEKLKKGKRTIIYGFVGFFLMRFPEYIIRAIYGGVECDPKVSGLLRICKMSNANPSDLVTLIGKVIIYFNGFLMLICVILVIYAGWLVMISGGDEEKLKKAKSTILYVFIGFIVLVASHAIFRFFILRG